VQWANDSMDKLVARARLDSPLEETIRDPDFLEPSVVQPGKQGIYDTARSILPGRTLT